jgi:hypothetical protein
LMNLMPLNSSYRGIDMFKIVCSDINEGRRVYGEMLSSLMTKYYDAYGVESKLLSMDYGIASHVPKIDKELDRLKVKFGTVLSVTYIKCQVHGFTLMFVTNSKLNSKSMPWGRRIKIEIAVYVDIMDDVWTIEYMLSRGGITL